MLQDDRMAEAEVSLRLAFYLLQLQGEGGHVEVAIDGAQVRSGGSQIFPLEEFLAGEGWTCGSQEGVNTWQATWAKGTLRMRIHCTSGTGDVVAIVRGTTVRAECKKGPLVRKKGSQEYPRLHEVLGQVLTIDEVGETDLLVAAVPRTQKFEALATRARTAPLLRRTGIRIALVARDGGVQGLEELEQTRSRQVPQ